MLLQAWRYRSPMWNDTDTPLAYFISFRTYGTWLHGDKRGSIDRFHNAYRSPYILKNQKWHLYNEQRLKAKPLILKARQRKSTEDAIRETCRIRKWLLHAINVRTNHIHAVVSANRKAGLVLNAFKPTRRDNYGKTAFGRTRLVRGQIRAASGDSGMNKALPELSTMSSTDREATCRTLISSERPTRYRAVVLTSSGTEPLLLAKSIPATR
jgi:hypothetical protein